MGFKGIIRYLLQQSIGMQHYEDNIDTILYFLNYYADIKTFPKATGNIRKLQEGDVLLLRIVDKVCKKYKFEYWIDAGTLLGAVRHKGFIPWDDDMDINMMRETYEKARPILEKELGQYGISVQEKTEEPIAHTGIGYHHNKTGLWIDLFPFEYSTVDSKRAEEIKEYNWHCLKYQKVWRNKKNKYTREQMFSRRKKMIPEICDREHAKSIINCPEWCPKPMVFPMETILPARPIMFEGYGILAPQKPEEYLTVFYGNYMGFPKSGLMHHGDKNGNLAERAKIHGIDMDQILEELEHIFNSI